MNKSNQRRLRLILGFSGLAVTAAALVCWHLFTEPEVQATRLMSLGTPKIVNLPVNEEKKVILNDPIMSKNWGLIGTKNSSIQADRAWSITQGSRNVVVAIIDTGVDANHPDLKNNLWTNPGETGFDSKGRDKSSNGIDDDGNGYVDDVHGWNFVANTNDLSDNHGHGTHIAGIIGAEGGNGIGISGVSPRVSLMILKYYDPKSPGTDNLKNTIKAIRYAVQNHARIINYSGGGLDFSMEEKNAIANAKDHGVLFVAAAGNEYSNSDKAHYYPANYDLDNIISVTAMNPSAEVLRSSNYGVRSVHIAAPGEQIYSTLPNNSYGLMTGTSQATAFVSGVAALIMANQKDFLYADVKRQILSSGDEVAGLRTKNETASKLNSWKALAMQNSNVTVSGVVQVTGAPVFSNEGYKASPNSNSVTQLRSLNNLVQAATRKPAEKVN